MALVSVTLCVERINFIAARCNRKTKKSSFSFGFNKRKYVFYARAAFIWLKEANRLHVSILRLLILIYFKKLLCFFWKRVEKFHICILKFHILYIKFVNYFSLR